MNSIPSNKILRSLITHDGPFHADEVCVCALLLYFGQIDSDKIVRKRIKKSEEYIPYEYVCDIGGLYDEDKKFFDHHQREYKGEKSSAGLVLAYLEKRMFISASLCDYLDNTFIKGVDAIDNGLATPLVGHASFSSVVESYMPLDQNVSSQDVDNKFMEALCFVESYLSRLVQRHQYLSKVRKKIEIVMEAGIKQHSGYLIFDEPLPWVELYFSIEKEIFCGEHPAKFIIMKAGDNYKLRTIPPSLDKRMDKRVPHPEDWCGLSGDELESVCHIKGAIFCHKNAFISIWKKKSAAIEAVKEILREDHE